MMGDGKICPQLPSEKSDGLEGGGTLLIAMVKPGFCIHHTHIVPNNLQYLSSLPTFQQTHIVKPILMTNAGEKIKKKRIARRCIR